MVKQRKTWTEEEDQFLRENVNKLSAKEIAEQLDKPLNSVYTHIRVLKLREPAYRKWTAAEDEYLISKYGTRELEKIASYLKRDMNSVTRRLERLGVNVKENLGVSTYELAAATNVDVHAVYRWMNNHGLPFKTAYSKERTYSVIDVQDFWTWAEKNKHLINFNRIEKYALLPEPSWVDEQRKIDFYNRPENEGQNWTEEQDERLWTLYYQQGLTLKEIGELLGRSAKSAQKRLSRIRTKRAAKSA